MKKFISILLVLVLILGCAVQVTAAEDDSAALQKAIQTVKSYVSIDYNNLDFEYYNYKAADSAKKGTVWNLTWHDKYYDTCLYATVSEEGELYGYSYFTNKEKIGIGTINTAQAEATAKAFLKGALPEKMRDVRVERLDSDPQRINFTFSHYVNGIKVYSLSSFVSVDKHTGMIIDYSADGAFEYAAMTFDATAPKLTEDDAKKIFLEKVGMELEYTTKMDWKEKTIDTFGSYRLPYITKYIDAQTGEVVVPGMGLYAGGRGSAEMYAYETAEKNDALTPEENEEVTSVKNLITKAEATQIVKSLVPNFGTVESANLSSAEYKQINPKWGLGSEDSWASVDAVTGELLSFSNYSNVKESTSGISFEKAKQIAQSTLLKYLGAEKAAQFKLRDFEDQGSVYGYESTSYYLYFERQVDGITFSGNNANISVNKADGRVLSYSMTWYNDLQFPSLEGAISQEAAFDNYVKDAGYGLMYIVDRKDSNKLIKVYGLQKDLNYAYLINPITGEKMSTEGGQYKEQVKGYDDISGKWYESIVTALVESGYYLDGSSFNGNGAITQENFLRYLFSPEQAYYDTDELYRMHANIIKAEEKNPTMVMTRQDAAKYIVRYMNLDKAGQLTGIYKNVYKDSISAEYAGYAALVKGLGIMQGDTKGRFNGTKTLTNAEAAVIVYNTLQKM